MNFYEILGLSRNASIEEVKIAYRKKAFDVHPDRNEDKEVADKEFKLVNAAYETLVDPIKRARYNSKLGGGENLRDTFSNLFEEFFGGTAAHGRHIKVRVEVSFDESYTGCMREIKIKKMGVCPTCSGKGGLAFVTCEKCFGNQSIRICPYCSGTGKVITVSCPDCVKTGLTPPRDFIFSVKIPPGIFSGEQICLDKGGEPGKRGLNPGNLYVVVIVKDSDIFSRKGDNLFCKIPLSFSQLVLGTVVAIKLPTGEICKLEIPKETSVGDQISLKQKGFSTILGKIGDFVGEIFLETPKNLDNEYKKAISELASFEDQFVTEKRKQFQERMRNG